MPADVEDVSFLPDAVNSHKRAVYEPTSVQRCQQLVLSQAKAIAIVVGAMLFILLIALIAAFARPNASNQFCPVEQTQVSENTHSAPDYKDTQGRDFPWKDIRLPTTIQPKAYWLRMQPNLTTFQFSGSVEIVLQATKPMDFLVLHSKKLNITAYSLKETDGKKGKIDIVKVQEYVAFEQIYMRFASELQALKNYTLRIDFNSVLGSQLYGFYRSSYRTKNNEPRYLATTQFEPTDARAAFPCFDEPALKASFRMSMVREERHFSLFNTPLVGTSTTANGLLLDEFEESVLMSTYLVAFVVCDFGSSSRETASGVKVTVYAPEEMLDQVDVALNSCTSIIEFYNDFFGVPYPLPKVDLIAIPDFSSGAMENWGLITYRMSMLLYDPEESSEANKQIVAVVVAHELAHQWFGNMVTMKWWNDLWLNEGFASFVEYLGTDHFAPDWNMMDQFVAETLIDGMHLDSLSSSHPISVVVEDPAQINEIFDQISYHKGSSIIRMLEDVIGREALQGGLKHYLKKHQFANADTDDLWAALSSQTNGINVKAVMDTWTRQMGYPVVTVARSGDRVKVTQQRFLLNPRGNQSTEFTSPYGYKWQIPLHYISSDPPYTPSDTIWLSEDSTTITVPGAPTWIKLNYGMRGVYRVHYDSATWRALLEQLMSDHTVFSAADRANLLDDAFALASAGFLDITVALDMTRYLVKERHYVPWKVALDNLGYIKSMLEEKPDYNYYAAYVKSLLEDTVAEVGWDSEGEHLQKYLRGLVLRTAVSLNHEATVDKAVSMFKDWMKNETTIHPNVKLVVYQAGVQQGGQAEWQFVWQQSQTTTVPSETYKLMYVLACTTDALRLNRYLHMTLDDTQIRKGDTVSVIGHVAANAAGRVLTWRFLRQNWATFQQRYEGTAFDMSALIQRTVSLFSTQYDYDEVGAFFREHESASGLRAISQALESIENNIDWLRNNERKCVDWLRTHAPAK